MPEYKALKQRQLRAAGSATDADAGDFEVQFEEDLYTPFYGGRQFGIRDINGLSLVARAERRAVMEYYELSHGTCVWEFFA